MNSRMKKIWRSTFLIKHERIQEIKQKGKDYLNIHTIKLKREMLIPHQQITQRKDPGLSNHLTWSNNSKANDLLLFYYKPNFYNLKNMNHFLIILLLLISNIHSLCLNYTKGDSYPSNSSSYCCTFSMYLVSIIQWAVSEETLETIEERDESALQNYQ